MTERPAADVIDLHSDELGAVSLGYLAFWTVVVVAVIVLVTALT